MLNKFLIINFILFINITFINALNLCTYSSHSKYKSLINNYPNLSDKFNILSKIPLPIWYTDRDSNSLNTIKDNLNNCNKLLSVVIIYGLPNKDCESGQSASGTNKNSNLKDADAMPSNQNLIIRSKIKLCS